MTINENTLSKGQIRKLNALRKSLGDKIAEDAFSKWMKSHAKDETVKVDPVAVKIEQALASLVNDKSLRLGSKGYIIKRSKGKGASGFAVSKVE
jgi:hypothetical protein